MNYIVLSLRNMFDKEQIGCMIRDINAGIQELDEDTIAAIVCVDESIQDVPKSLIKLKDLAMNKSIPMLLLCDEEMKDTVHELVPAQFFKAEFKRPFNASEIVQKVLKFTKVEARGNRKKLLLVDDAGTVLRTMKALFEKKYEVMMANSGAMCFKAISLNRPDLIILDYEMPICDGATIFKMLKAEPEYADIPVIFLTGKNDKESVMQVMALKPQGYLLKNMEPGKILSLIDNFFQSQNLQN